MDNLNEQQREAIRYIDGPALVLAGPGTGKTHTIASRVSYLIKEGVVAPEEIFVITFTNRAAIELKERISSYLKDGHQLPFTGTFHRLGLEIIRRILNPVPSLISRYEQTEILRELGVKKAIEKVLNRISYRKNTMTEPEEEIKDIYEHYSLYLKENNLIDIDDLLIVPVKLIGSTSEQSEIHLIVDEYQDINPSAHRFINAFLSGSRNLFAVGDPDQAIYSFRGSSIDIIMKFQDIYSGARIFKLKKSYRFSRNIISVAEEIIKNNTNRLPKETIALKDKGKKVRLIMLPDQYREAEFIASEIERQVGGSAHYSLYKGGLSEESKTFSDFAILVRIRALMPLLESKLQEKGIPVCRATGSGVINYPAIKALLEELDGFESYDIHEGSVGIVEFLKDIIGKSGFSTQLSRDEKEMLLRIASGFNSLSLDRAIAYFKDELKMLRDTDLLQERAEQVTLLTMHAAKGLEFPVVFIAGTEDGIVPYTKRYDYDLEEERRLFYVALTRAKEEVIITCAKRRMLYGEALYSAPTRFLNLPEGLLEKVEVASRKENFPKQDSLF